MYFGPFFVRSEAPDRTRAPLVLVPLLSLGRRAIATEGGGARSGTFSFALAAVPAGGPELQPAHLSPDLFEAAAIRVVNRQGPALGGPGSHDFTDNATHTP